MFDEDCYNKGFEAMDKDFRSGRYYLVSDPRVQNPNDRVIHLQQDSKNAYNKRGGSNNNLLIAENAYASLTNGYHGRGEERGWREGYDHREWEDHRGGQTSRHKSRSINNLNDAFYSPKSNDSNNRGRAEELSSFEYYKRYGGPTHARGHEGYGKDRFAISSDERSTFRQQRQPTHGFDSFSNDFESNDEFLVGDRNIRVVPRSVQRAAENDHVARSWESRSSGVGQRIGGVSSHGLNDRPSNSDAFVSDKHYRHHSHVNNNNGNSYGDVRPIKVERTESSGTTPMSARDYWESRWSSGSSDDRGGYVKSASPSLSGNVGRPARGQTRSTAQYLSTDNLAFSGHRSTGNFIEGSRPRLSSRVIYDGNRGNALKPENSFTNPPSSTASRNAPSQSSRDAPNEKEFLSKIQQELEFQRRNLTGEIDKLLSPMGSELEKARSPFGSPPSSANVSSSSYNAEKNSFVDTSGPCPIFKAFVDVSDFPPNSVTVGVDNFGNKVIVEANQSENSQNHVAMSFTQKLPLPRYADVTSISAKLNRKGVVKIEVPLFFHFPSDNASKGSVDNLGKSFVYEVKTDSKDGSKVMEIVVKPGPDVSLNDVRVEVAEDGQLTVYVEKQPTVSGKTKQRRVIKTYSLPNTAMLEAITSKMATDGTLTISVPISRSLGVK